MCWNCWPGQPVRLGQIVKTPSSGFTVGVPQSGHFFGGFGFRSALALALLDHRRDDLRDHVAGAQHDHLVALADVLALQVLLVVEGRGGDGDAADVDRLQHRERQQVPGPPDVPDDLVQLRRRGRRRELPGDRPARLAPGHPELALQAAVVHLDDDAVDLEVELRRGGPPTSGSASRPRRRPCGASTSSLTGKPRSRSHSSISLWLSGSQPPRAADPVGPQRERPGRGDRWNRAGAASRRRSCAGWRRWPRPPRRAAR